MYNLDYLQTIKTLLRTNAIKLKKLKNLNIKEINFEAIQRKIIL